MQEPAAKPDRRVQRTREMLLDALHGLMLERGYERLTIQNVLDRAGVGRATFYAHFDNKEELLACSVERLRSGLTQPDPGAQIRERLAFTLRFFRHLDSHRRMYLTTVVPEHEVTVQRYILRMLRELVREDIGKHWRSPPRDGRQDLAVQFAVNALWSTVVWWIESKSRLAPEEVNQVFQRLTFPGLDTVLGR